MTEITLANIRPGTIIVTCGKLAIVEEVTRSRPKNPIAYKNNTDHRGYICGLSQVQAILGDVDIAAWKAGITPVVKRELFPTEDRWAMPEALKSMNLKIGDTIEVRHGRGGLAKAIYKGYNSSRPKYPVSYEIDGKQWKGVAATVVRKVGDAQAA